MRRAQSALVATLGLLIAACGGDAVGTTTTTTTIQSTSTSTTFPETTTTTTRPTTATTVVTTTTGPPGTTTTTIAGEPVDFGPSDGDVLMVIGVRHDDSLNLREFARVDADVIELIPPTADDVAALGQTLQLPSSFWTLIEYGGFNGWVNLRYLGYEGDTTDDTARIISEIGETPVEDSMTDLGELVAEQYASQDEPESDIVQVTPVSSGDLAEVTYDVVGLGDDAVRGVRVHVFAEETSSRFTLKSVEVTAICGRGVDNGACV